MYEVASPSPRVVAVSVVIPTRNRFLLLRDAVASVLTGRTVPAEILVIDQSDISQRAVPDGSAIGVAVSYYWSRIVGASRARNIGVAKARHPVIAFLDDDMLVSHTWLETLLEAMDASGPTTILTGQVRAGVSEKPGSFAPSTKVDHAPALYVGRVDADVLYSGCMMAHRTAMEAAGGFDERFGPGSSYPAAEDNDLGHRLLAAGFRIRYVPDAVVYHRAWRTGVAAVLVNWRYGRGQGAYYAKYMRERGGHTLQRAGRDLHQSVLCVCLGVIRPRAAIAEVAYVCGLLAGAAQWWLKETPEFHRI